MLTQTYFPNYVLAPNSALWYAGPWKGPDLHEKRPPSPRQHGNRSAGRLRVVQQSMKWEGRQQMSSCPGVCQVQQTHVEKHYLCCQVRDKLCPTTGLYSSRFKSRPQEVDNSSYLGVSQTTVGMQPLARQELEAGSSMERAANTTVCSPIKPEPLPGRQPAWT